MTIEKTGNGTLIGDKRELTRENEKNTWCKMKLTTDSEKLARRKKRRNKRSRQNRGKNYEPIYKPLPVELALLALLERLRRRLPELVVLVLVE